MTMQEMQFCRLSVIISTRDIGSFVNLSQGSNDLISYVGSFMFAAQQTEETLPETALKKHLLTTVSDNLQAAHYALDTRSTTFDEL